MLKTTFKTLVGICVISAFASCTETAEEPTQTEEQQQEETVEQEETTPEPEEIVEESPFGNFSGLVGTWTVDAQTAGVQLDLTFGEDGSFKQSMGTIQATGTWSRVDEEHINVVTQNTSAKGQTWKVADLTEETVNFTWNITSPKPKTIPMARAK